MKNNVNAPKDIGADSVSVENNLNPGIEKRIENLLPKLENAMGVAGLRSTQVLEQLQQAEV
jgi:hypothetical protein